MLGKLALLIIVILIGVTISYNIDISSITDNDITNRIIQDIKSVQSNVEIASNIEKIIP